MRKLLISSLLMSLAVVTPALGQDMPADYTGVLTTLNRQGDYKDNVLKVNIPRSDLKAVVDGVATPTPLGFGGGIIHTKGTGGTDDVVRGQVLIDGQANARIYALLVDGLAVT